MRSRPKEREHSRSTNISRRISSPTKKDSYPHTTPVVPVPSSEQQRKCRESFVKNEAKCDETPTNEIDFSEIKQRFLEELNIKPIYSYSNKVSPTLAQLRLTPALPVEEKRRILIQKHEAARKNTNQLAVGGGVSIWPEMAKMRLNTRDIFRLATLSLVLALLVGYVFFKIHGYTVNTLQQFSVKLMNFSASHPIQVTSGYSNFHGSIVHWHTDFRNLLMEILEAFDVSQPPWSYQLYIFSYISGILLLLYYLFESIYAKSKLSPNRIRRWVSLLTVITCWTALMLFLLKCAQNVENLMESNVHQLNEVMGVILTKEYEAEYFQNVLLYWRTRCLPPSSQGTLKIFGILSIRDANHYLQYYSLPLLTVLVSPVIRLIMALYSMYNVQ